MARAAKPLRPGSRIVRFDLRGRQRTHFLRMAGAATAAGLAPMLLLRPWTMHRPPADDLWFCGSWAALMIAVALYYVRVAYGWVVVDAAGLRTSRLIRGRFIPWTDVESITTRTYRGKGGQVTVVKVHTMRRWTFLLPAPRTTEWSDREFNKAVRYLLARVNSAPPPTRRRRWALRAR